MIHKILLSLASAATIVSILFCWKNRSGLTEARQQKDQINAQIEKKIAEITALKDEVVSVQDLRAKAEAQRDERSAELESVQRKLKAAQTEEARVQAIYDKSKSEYDRLAGELDKLPAGVSPETLGQDIDGLEATLTERSTELESLNRSMEIAETSLEKNQKALDSQQERQRQRLKGYDINSLEARVTAVDPVWGFVVVDAGSQQGLTPESALLVIDESSRPVGGLDIIQLESGSAVANYQTMGVGKQRGVEPGDRVILRRPNN